MLAMCFWKPDMSKLDISSDVMLQKDEQLRATFKVKYMFVTNQPPLASNQYLVNTV